MAGALCCLLSVKFAQLFVTCAVVRTWCRALTYFASRIYVHDMLIFLFIDGLNVVSANCTLRTIPVDHKMLKSSLTLRGANLTAKDLLNMENFDRLSEG